MKTQSSPSLWTAFLEINHRRRAIRDFDRTAVLADGEVREILTEAARAPSSGNLQPYRFHWVRDPDMRARLAAACNGQRAAASAAALIVVAASPQIALSTASQQLAHVSADSELPERAKVYHRKQLRMFRRVLGTGSWAPWTLLTSLAALIRPALSLLPVGHLGGRGWVARNSAYAAQTLMLAAAAKGIDSCPMEGFSAPKVVDLLGLPRGTVIPVIIALGYRASNARVEQQWRRASAEAVVEH
ncbi:nitroreductase family protein [Variovorax atrisoli]|uniref:nitroreductase family protein n=1 Tax=Variovorax atrisoli TaxID=3394203 RepID=UPI00036EC3A2|nr:nitroreductase family protein [Variovorax paradoxus]